MNTNFFSLFNIKKQLVLSQMKVKNQNKRVLKSKTANKTKISKTSSKIKIANNKIVIKRSLKINQLNQIEASTSQSTNHEKIQISSQTLNNTQLFQKIFTFVTQMSCTQVKKKSMKIAFETELYVKKCEKNKRVFDVISDNETLNRSNRKIKKLSIKKIDVKTMITRKAFQKIINNNKTYTNKYQKLINKTCVDKFAKITKKTMKKIETHKFIFSIESSARLKQIFTSQTQSIEVASSIIIFEFKTNNKSKFIIKTFFKKNAENRIFIVYENQKFSTFNVSKNNRNRVQKKTHIFYAQSLTKINEKNISNNDIETTNYETKINIIAKKKKKKFRQKTSFFTNDSENFIEINVKKICDEKIIVVMNTELEYNEKL